MTRKKTVTKKPADQKVAGVQLTPEGFNKVISMLHELPFREAQPILRAIEENHTVVHEDVTDAEEETQKDNVV